MPSVRRVPCPRLCVGMKAQRQIRKFPGSGSDSRSIRSGPKRVAESSAPLTKFSPPPSHTTTDLQGLLCMSSICTEVAFMPTQSRGHGTRRSRLAANDRQTVGGAQTDSTYYDHLRFVSNLSRDNIVSRYGNSVLNCSSLTTSLNVADAFPRGMYTE